MSQSSVPADAVQDAVQLEVNELLQVRVSDDPNSSTYRSRVENIIKGKLLISWPTSEGIRLLAHRDQLLELHFVRDGVPHEFSGMVDELQTEPLPQLTIIQSSAAVKVQRRQNYRIKCVVPVEIVGSRVDASMGLLLKTTTTDLSASGLSFAYLRRIPPGTLLDVRLSLPDDGPTIKIPCKAVYSDEAGDSQMMYRTGLEYAVISEAERARIVRYVYRTQLRGLRV